MQLNIAFIATAILASASLALSATVTAFDGADCTGTQGKSFTTTIIFSPPICFSLEGGSAKSFSYSGVTNEIEFFISGGGHDFCTNGSQLTLGSGAGCATAPAG